ncbi:unnamed protein product, partial [Prorocentrum cordatum]
MQTIGLPTMRRRRAPPRCAAEPKRASLLLAVRSRACSPRLGGAATRRRRPEGAAGGAAGAAVCREAPPRRPSARPSSLPQPRPAPSHSSPLPHLPLSACGPADLARARAAMPARGGGSSQVPHAVRALQDPAELEACWICLGEERNSAELGRLCSPCACRGSQGYVHMRCLKQWVQKSVDNTYGRDVLRTLRCPTCK